MINDTYLNENIKKKLTCQPTGSENTTVKPSSTSRTDEPRRTTTLTKRKYYQDLRRK